MDGSSNMDDVIETLALVGFGRGGSHGKKLLTDPLDLGSRGHNNLLERNSPLGKNCVSIDFYQRDKKTALVYLKYLIRSIS